MSGAELVRHNLDKQRELYGELFGERARRLVVGFDISQAQLADVLGVSAPMLSQVMSGRRQKMSIPAALARMVLLERALLGARGHQQRREALAEIRSCAPVEAMLAAAAPGRDSVVNVLREMCGPEELAECAHLVGEVSPALADLLTQAAYPKP